MSRLTRRILLGFIGVCLCSTAHELGAAEPDTREAVAARQTTLRHSFRTRLVIPHETVPLEPEYRGSVIHGDVVVEKWIINTEPGSRAPALLYRPRLLTRALPGIVLTHGHGDSKSTWAQAYAGLLYARVGLACLVMDPLGEEERNLTGRQGTRAHDSPEASERLARSGRTIMGKFVFDTMRGIDFMQSRDFVDAERIGVAGMSLGGAVASWTAALDARVRVAIVASWAFADGPSLRGKLCTRIPYTIMKEECDWPEFIGLAAPHCAVLVMNGTADTILDDGGGSAWRETRDTVNAASKWWTSATNGREVAAWFEEGGGHRPYHLYRDAVVWIQEKLGMPDEGSSRITQLNVQRAGTWLDRHQITQEKLYGTELHWRGSTLLEHGLSPIPGSLLAVLHPDEVGQRRYTLEGWIGLLGPNEP